MSCSRCGAELPERARFCLECGRPVADQRVAELRKTVTLLFTDLTSSTALGERIDPEAYRLVMGRYFEVARLAVERHGGTVEKFVGDAVLAVFGIPDVREDDALRAVRAADELRRDFHDLAEELEATMGVRLQVRTGVNTGAVVAGPARAGGSFATGDAVNTAARLEQAAAPGEVLIGPDTYLLVADAVEVEAVEPVSAKGKAEPIQAYRLLGVRAVEHGGRARRFDGRLVGRERESRTLLDTLDRTVELRRGHLVTVLGVPGIGKTRLVNDFVKQIDGRAVVVSGRCVSYGQGITFWPVVQLLRQALSLHGDESSEVTRHAVGQLLVDSPDAPRVASLLLALMGKGEEPGSSDETFWAVQRAIEQLASRRPLVVTVDDLHWAEPTLLGLLEHLRDEVRDLPLLLVCQARPELLDTRPGWGGGSLNSVTFGLEPFTTAQTALSLADLLGENVTREVATAVFDRAGGNPLFVEEVVRHLLDHDLLHRSPDGGWALSGELADAHVPPTVAALLAARLDRLPAGERRLAERISVVGLEVTEEDARALAGVGDPVEIRGLLAALTRRDVLRRQGGDEGDTWAFRHILVRDAAYESLPKALRADLHERYAAHVADSGDEAGGERAAFVAHHLERALHHRLELGVMDDQVRALAERTLAALTEAGIQARDRLDFAAATSILRRAVAVDAIPWREWRAAVLRLLHVLFGTNQLAETAEVIETFARQVEEHDRGTDRPLLACLRLWCELGQGAEVDPADLETAADAALAVSRPLDDRLATLLVMSSKVDARSTAARWTGIATMAQEVADIGGPYELRQVDLYRITGCIHGERPLTDLELEMARLRAVASRTPVEELILTAVQTVCWAAAADPRADGNIELLLLHFEENSDRHLPLTFSMFAHALAGHLAAAGRIALRLAALNEETQDLSHASTEIAWAGWFELELGDPEGSARGLIEKAATYTSRFDVISVAMVAAGRCRLAARDGDHEEAERQGRVAIEAARRSDQLWQTADTLRHVAWAAQLRGDVEEERRLLGDALDLYRHKEIVHWTRVVEARLAELDQER